MRLRALTAGTAALTFALPLPSARAHRAEGLAYQGVSGPYLISVLDGRAVVGSDLAEYRLVLTQDPRDGQMGAQAPVLPVPGARVRITTANGARTKADGVGNVYFFSLPDITQKIKVAIEAAPGRAELEVAVHGLEGTDLAADRRDWQSPAALATAAFGAILLVVGAVRRRRTASARPASGSSDG